MFEQFGFLVQQIAHKGNKYYFLDFLNIEEGDTTLKSEWKTYYSVTKVTFSSPCFLSGSQTSLHIELPRTLATTQALKHEEHHSQCLQLQIDKQIGSSRLKGRGTALNSNLFMAEEVLIKFMGLKIPTYQPHCRAVQGSVNRNHQSISHFNEMKQINRFFFFPRKVPFRSPFLVSDLLCQVHMKTTCVNLILAQGLRRSVTQPVCQAFQHQRQNNDFQSH